MAKMPDLAVGPAEPTDLEELARVLGWAFADLPLGATTWFERLGVEHLRVGRAGGRILGGLGVIPMGQWFGGVSVPMLGVAGVAVAPEARGHGVALSLMRATLAEARARGTALSALYPATWTLYRLAGYELAGSRFRYTALLKDLPTSSREDAIFPITDGDRPEVERMYQAWARVRTGSLDRGEYIWHRVRYPRGAQARGFLVRGNEGVEGYYYASQRVNPGDKHDLVLSDFVALTSRAARSLFGLLADHRSTARSVVWHAGYPDALLLEQSELATKVELSEHFMLRVVHAEAALRARGFPMHDADVELELADAELPDNAGRYRIAVRNGRADVSRGGNGRVRLDARAFAALYSGFLRASELARSGRLSGDAASIDTLDGLFGGGIPGLPDFF